MSSRPILADVHESAFIKRHMVTVDVAKGHIIKILWRPLYNRAGNTVPKWATSYVDVPPKIREVCELWAKLFDGKLPLQTYLDGLEMELLE